MYIHEIIIIIIHFTDNYSSQDKTCILWDSNKLLFVRQLMGHQTPVTILSINQLNVSF